MATEVFRFMDLPTEVRDRIYHTSLCTWPPKLTDEEKMKSGFVVVPDQLAYIHRKPDIGILLANHRIYRDALDVLLKGNLFIRLMFRGVHMRSVMLPKQVPVVAEGESVVNAFTGYFMTHTIDMSDKAIYPPDHLMILGRDLEHFCQALAGCGIAQFGKESKHTVEIHKPFADTASPNYLDVKNQERLLQPYRKHLRGFTSFQVVGNVQPGLAQAVTREVKQDPTEDPQDLLRELLEQKELGNKYFTEGNNTMASETWAKATLKLIRLERSNVWARMKAETDEDWHNSITEIFFQLNSNMAMNTLRVMQKAESTNPELAGQYAGSLYNAVQSASGASNMFGTSWRPSEEQDVKLAYRLAAAHRIARDNIDVAEHCINEAARRFPDNATIQWEKKKIRQWRASGGW